MCRYNLTKMHDFGGFKMEKFIEKFVEGNRLQKDEESSDIG